MAIVRSVLCYFLIFSFSLDVVSAVTFKVVTLNTWLLPSILGVSKDRELRKTKMPSWLSSSGADVIALQEVWTEEDQDFLIGRMSEIGYPYSARARSRRPWVSRYGRGVLGNGLLAFSKYEIREGVHLHSFSSFTRVDEYFAEKGVIHFEVNLPDLGWTDFYDVHLGAVYFDSQRGTWYSDHIKAQDLQGQEMLQFVEDTKSHAVQIIAGDLNAHPFEWQPEIKSFSAHQLRPLYGQLTSGDLSGRTSFVDTFREVDLERGMTYTYDRSLNSYAEQGSSKQEPSIFCDYVLLNRNQKEVAAVTSELKFNQAWEGEGGGRYFLSDHFGVLTTFMTRSAESALGQILNPEMGTPSERKK